MLREELNEHSPMRVFEATLQGGLGRGNIGVVAAGPGVGKTALLVQIALDGLLHDRRVLHISREHAVDHVRSYYDEIFHDLSATSRLSNPDTVQLELERHRLIFSLLSQSVTPTGSRPGEDSPASKLGDVIDFAGRVAEFHPDVIIIDGFDLVGGADQTLSVLRELARVHDAELWISSAATPLPDDREQLPEPLETYAAQLDVIVFLNPQLDVIELRVLKEHDRICFAAPQLRLVPRTMRVVQDDARQGPPRPRTARTLRLISGGATGAGTASRR